MREFSEPAVKVEEYLKFWFTEAKNEWEAYKRCLTKWRDLLETGMSADDHRHNFEKWASRLMSYEEWADTNTQPAPTDKVEFNLTEYSYEEVVEWLIGRMYVFPSAEAYTQYFWTGINTARSYHV